MIEQAKAADGGAEQADARVRCQALVSELIQRWRDGAAADAAAVLAAQPELQQFRSLVLDLVYEEFCIRSERGERVDTRRFATRFPGYEDSVALGLAVHRLLDRQLPPPMAEAAAWPHLESSYAGYWLQSELGRGGFARVYLARELEIGQRWVALKISLQGAQEADILGQLDHPGIVPIYSLRQSPEGWSVICMPFLGKATLQQVLDHSRPVPARARAAGLLAAAVDVANQSLGEQLTAAPRGKPRGTFTDALLSMAVGIARALAHAHGRGVLHLDLKPSNVLVLRDGTPLLLDFNLSRDQHSGRGALGGTLPYMAPEQLQQLSADTDPPAPDARSDVFALGVLLHESLYDELPFATSPNERPVSEIAHERLLRQQQGPRRPARPNPQVNRSLARLVERCLAFEPDQRPQSAEELARLLRHQLRWRHRAQRWTSLHPKITLGGTVLAVLLLLTTTLLLALRAPYHVRHQRTAEQALANGTLDSALHHVNLVLATTPQNPEALLLRAKVKVAMEQRMDAIHDGLDAFELAARSEIAALVAWCYSREKYHYEAVAWYERAIALGFVTADIYYNLGWSNYFSARQQAAYEAWTRAIDLCPSDLDARHSRALVDLQNSELRRVPLRTALHDIDVALSLREPSPPLLEDAAAVYLLAAYYDPEKEEAAIELVKRAIAAGRDAKLLRIRWFAARLVKKYPSAFYQDPTVRPVRSGRIPVNFRELVGLSGVSKNDLASEPTDVVR